MARRIREPRSMRRALVTPEGVRLDLQLATAGARAGAFAIDGLIMIAILIGFTLLAFLAFSIIGKQVPTVIGVIWLLGFFLLRNFYFVFNEARARAATPGKRILKLRVIARDGGRLTVGAVLARNMMREIEVYLPLSSLPFAATQGFAGSWTVLLGFLWTAIFLFFPLFNRDRLRPGDLIAGTWVVVNERRKIGVELLSETPAESAIAPFTTEELAAYGQFELQRLEEVLRKDDQDAMVTVAAAIRRKIGRADDRRDREFLDAYYAALRQELERKLLFGRRKADKFDTAA